MVAYWLINPEQEQSERRATPILEMDCFSGLFADIYL